MEQVFTACQCDLSCAYFVSFSLSLSYQSKFSVSVFSIFPASVIINGIKFYSLTE